MYRPLSMVDAPVKPVLNRFAPTTVRVPAGEVVPIPMLPLEPSTVRADMVVVAIPWTVVVER